jgi:hypothetical protein
MNTEDIKLLEENGWDVDCESPFEISDEDGNFARGLAAKIVLEDLKSERDDFDEDEMGEAFRAGHERGIYVASVIKGTPIDGHYPQFNEFLEKLKQKRLEE